MDKLVQLQARDFITFSRPMLTGARRPLSDYEIASRRLDGIPLTEAIDPRDFIDENAHLHPRYESQQADGSFKVRATLITVNRPKHGSWYEVRVGTRYRFSYRNIKEATRAFKALCAENLQPYGWAAKDGVPPPALGGFQKLLSIVADAA